MNRSGVLSLFIMRSIIRSLTKIVLFTIVAALQFGVGAASVADNRDRSFDAEWRFLRAAAPGVDSPVFDDSTWRTLDVPHDWSIEDLPAADASDQSATNRVGPFDRSLSKGGGATGHFVGGTPNEPASFHVPLRKTFQGRCLAILRPKGDAGEITLKAEADGLKPATVVVRTRSQEFAP